jgi:hypothetical protein
VRQPGADHHERGAALGHLVAGCAQCGHVVGQQVLHLVDEDRNALARIGRQPGDVREKLDKVDLDVTGVGPPDHCRHVDAGLPATRRLAASRSRRFTLCERFEHAEDMALLVRAAAGKLADREVQRRRERVTQRLVRAGFELSGAPAATYSRAAHRVEQHRLADTAQSGQHDGPLGAAPRDAFEHHVERLEFGVTTSQFRRALARARSVRVAYRIHARNVSSSLANPRDFARFVNRVVRSAWSAPRYRRR